MVAVCDVQIATSAWHPQITNTCLLFPRNQLFPLQCEVPMLIKKALSFIRWRAKIIGDYTEIHRRKHFAGNLEALRNSYAESSGEAREKLIRLFDVIVSELTLRNGIAKMTYVNRLVRSLSAILPKIQPPRRQDVRVLDVPASTGSSSLASLALLREHGYAVSSYVLGDLSFWILFDPRRQCIFDDQGNLLQVAFGPFFINIYRGGITGDEYTFVTRVLAFPHAVMAYCLRRIYRFQRDGDYRRLAVVHPEVEKLLENSVFRLADVDVFRPISGQYDLILSFNLLQLNYFPSDVIKSGVRNLADALCEGGFLIMGNTEAYVAYQKQDGSLVARLQEGQF
jgi:hypothetical protein